MGRIHALIHHHCGDHCYCDMNDCRYLQRERHHIAKKHVEVSHADADEQKVYAAKTREDKLDLLRDDINDSYAQISRFKGM